MKPRGRDGPGAAGTGQERQSAGRGCWSVQYNHTRIILSVNPLLGSWPADGWTTNLSAEA
ncbi:hypothetical protein [Azospirillum palustre]